MNYYERHIGDYLKDTAHLSLLEHGVYGRMLDVYYTRENGIEAGDYCRLIGARSQGEKAAVQSVLVEFFELVGTVWTHKRCDREIDRYRRKAERNREVGKLGGRPRKSETHEKPIGLLVGYEPEPTPNPPSNQSPVTKKTNTPPTPVGGAGRFEQFWLAYPSKVGKDAARKAFEKRSPDAELLGAMLAALAAQTASPRWQKDGGQYIPNPSTWLNQARWQDEAHTIAVVDGGRREVEATRDYLARQAEHAARAKGPTPEVLAKLRGVARVAT